MKTILQDRYNQSITAKYEAYVDKVSSEELKIGAIIIDLDSNIN